MKLLSLLLVLAYAGYSFAFSLEPTLEWPEEYHFNGEELDLVTGIVKPFQIWYSTKHNRSRIDLYGGVVSRFYYGAEDYDLGKMYMIHPEVAEDDSKTEIKCDVMPHFDEQQDFLPDLSDFEYSGTTEHDGKQVQVWKRTEEMAGVMTSEETLLVENMDGDVGIPLHHYKMMLNEKDGSIHGKSVMNYYNYDDKISVDDLDADKRATCDDWSLFTQDFHEAVKVLYPAIDSDVDLAFHRFKRHHYRDYVDQEHHLRKAIFKHNWDFVVNHNKKNLGYTLGLNQFADKTMSELSYLNGVMKSDPIRGTHPFPHSEEKLASLVEKLPEEFDLRMEGVISPVRNQANCGSCWAFAMSATMEGAWSRANGGQIIDLSEQSLVDCAWAFRNHGCRGAEALDGVFEYVMIHGIPTVEEYGPYIEEDGYCRIKNMTNLYGIKGYVAVTRNSPNALKVAVYENGPVLIGVLVTRKMAMYKSGVFYDYDCEPQAMNHAVTLVGYGIRDGELYWLVKNSWGESWGESGYILISAKDNNCNIMTVPYYPVL